MSEYIEDGFGSTWVTCSRDDCDLHVVRPGKAACYHPECEDNSDA